MRSDPALVILAGDRGPDDPLARAGGVAGKVLVEVAGRPMLYWVLNTAAQTRCSSRLLVCPSRPEYKALAQAAGIDGRIEPAAGPAASVALALDALAPDQSVLVITGDHPLLRVEWLEDFAQRAEATGADAVAGVVDYRTIRQAWPESRRTRYRFSDIAACGTNLFWFNGKRGRAVAALWQDFESDRKRPWRIVARLGWMNLASYLTGRLTLGRAMHLLSKRFGCRLDAVLLDDPEAAVDVDSPADLELVRDLFQRRRQMKA